MRLLPSWGGPAQHKAQLELTLPFDLRLVPTLRPALWRSPHDAEIGVLAGGLLPLDIDAVDAGGGRAVEPPPPLRFARRIGAFEPRFAAPTVEVAPPPFDAGATGALTGRRAKVAPLNPPADRDVRSHPLHIETPHSCSLTLNTSIG